MSALWAPRVASRPCLASGPRGRCLCPIVANAWSSSSSGKQSDQTRRCFGSTLWHLLPNCQPFHCTVTQTRWSVHGPAHTHSIHPRIRVHTRESCAVCCILHCNRIRINSASTTARILLGRGVTLAVHMPDLARPTVSATPPHLCRKTAAVGR